MVFLGFQEIPGSKRQLLDPWNQLSDEARPDFSWQKELYFMRNDPSEREKYKRKIKFRPLILPRTADMHFAIEIRTASLNPPFGNLNGCAPCTSRTEEKFCENKGAIASHNDHILQKCVRSSK